MSKSSTRASYILTCLSFSDVGLSNVTSLVENLFSPSKVSSLVVVVVMVVGGGGGGGGGGGWGSSSLCISYSSSKEHVLEKQGILSIMMISFPFL